MSHKLIILYGPTASGKSDLSLFLGEHFPVEIVNVDVGQFYKPLSIGTAKPDWQHQKTPHHFFDILSEPVDYSVAAYRKHVLALCDSLWKKGVTPLLVGGSGFYIRSLFFPCKDIKQEHHHTTITYEYATDSPIATEDLWDRLHMIDKARALQIHKNDRYRIERALMLIQKTGSASLAKPSYENLNIPILVIGLMRDRHDLYTRINQRTESMLASGWIEEVEALKNSEWFSFFKKKKLIGYNDIIDYIELREPKSKEDLSKVIAQKTRHYAKRQMTFWRMLKKELSYNFIDSQMVYELTQDDEEKNVKKVYELVLHFMKKDSL